jgi:hypothetical protein
MTQHTKFVSAWALIVLAFGCSKRDSASTPPTPTASPPALASTSAARPANMAADFPTTLISPALVANGTNPVVLHTTHGDVEVRFVGGEDTPVTAIVRAGNNEHVVGSFDGTDIEVGEHGADIAIAFARHDVKGDDVELEAHRLAWSGDKLVVAETYASAGGSAAPGWLPPKMKKLMALTPYDYEPPSVRKAQERATLSKLRADALGCQCGDSECKDAIERRLTKYRQDHTSNELEADPDIELITATVNGC